MTPGNPGWNLQELQLWSPGMVPLRHRDCTLVTYYVTVGMNSGRTALPVVQTRTDWNVLPTDAGPGASNTGTSDFRHPGLQGSGAAFETAEETAHKRPSKR